MSADGGLLVTINGVVTPASQDLETAVHKDPTTDKQFVTRPGHTTWVADLRKQWGAIYPEWATPGAVGDKVLCKIIVWGWHVVGCRRFFGNCTRCWPAWTQQVPWPRR
eukprot:6383394-Heterocapsa_arctica.AAC.1